MGHIPFPVLRGTFQRNTSIACAARPALLLCVNATILFVCTFRLQIAFFLTIFIWAKAESFTTLSSSASESFPRFLSTVSAELVLPRGSASDSRVPAVTSFLQLETLSGSFATTDRSGDVTAAAPYAGEPRPLSWGGLGALIPAGVAFSNPLLGALAALASSSSTAAAGADASQAINAPHVSHVLGAMTHAPGRAGRQPARGSGAASSHLARFASASLSQSLEEAEAADASSLSGSASASGSVAQSAVLVSASGTASAAALRAAADAEVAAAIAFSSDGAGDSAHGMGVGVGSWGEGVLSTLRRGDSLHPDAHADSPSGMHASADTSADHAQLPAATAGGHIAPHAHIPRAGSHARAVAASHARMSAASEEGKRSPFAEAGLATSHTIFDGRVGGAAASSHSSSARSRLARFADADLAAASSSSGASEAEGVGRGVGAQSRVNGGSSGSITGSGSSSVVEDSGIGYSADALASASPVVRAVAWLERRLGFRTGLLQVRAGAAGAAAEDANSEGLGGSGVGRTGPAAAGSYVLTFPHHVETAGLVLECFLAVMTIACLIVTHVTPPGGWKDVAARAAVGDISAAQLHASFREWKVKEPELAKDDGGAAGRRGGASKAQQAAAQVLADAADAALAKQRAAAANILALAAVADEERRRAAISGPAASSSGGCCKRSSPPSSGSSGSAGATGRSDSSTALVLGAAMPVGSCGSSSSLSPTALRPSLLRTCNTCRWPPGSDTPAPKPDRCHHCTPCGQCVLEMDHHCPWVGNCIGAGNRKPFLLVLTYGSLALAVFLIWMAPNFVQALQSLADLRRQFVYLFAYFLAALLWMVLTGFWAFHLHLLLSGLTTIEWCEKSSHSRKAGAKDLQPPEPAIDKDGKVSSGGASGASGASAGAGDGQTLMLQESGADGRVRTAAQMPAAGSGGLVTDEGTLDRLLQTGPVALVGLPSADFILMPEARLAPLLKAQLYSRSPYDVGAWRNFTSIFGSNPLFWALPASWGVPERPPYETNPRFDKLRSLAAAREDWREDDAHAAAAAAVELEWARRHGREPPLMLLAPRYAAQFAASAAAPPGRAAARIARELSLPYRSPAVDPGAATPTGDA